ncbi:NAD(P)H-dependent oxidoreductase [Alicyclobacillus tolerans]|uniref:NADPH-dependent FMN reductase n=1 Tax=Alicyclobacillus tolerans TaxID=90970 RepID=UPI001F2CB708|nr:NADPH-dependent FMN reductase [Alicyclobacillus tolerans]MCF8563459.1 NAD(P)H-dependent oxidoreductase [Alicyclobacillus tolerans]
MELIGLLGSLRKDSYNQALLNTVADRYKSSFTLSIADISTLPFFNQDEENSPPPVVEAFKQRIAQADGVVIATPEYNWSVPGVLKNALDWMSRGQKVLVGKPVLVVGASTGMMGTLRAQLHLREVLSSPGLSCRMLPPGGNEVLVTFSQDKFENGQLTDAPTLAFLDDVVRKFIALV